MTQPLHRTLIACIALAAFASRARAGAQEPANGSRSNAARLERWVGTWHGTLAAGAGVRLALTIRQDSTGALNGLMRNVDQPDVQAIAAIGVSGDTLRFAIAGEHITFVGVANAAGDSIRGIFSQGATLPLTLARAPSSSLAAAVSTRPQTPQPPFPYRSEDVSIPSVNGVRLAGTVILPRGAGPFPAVVFITGSGAQDRDETILGHHPFLVIADFLARHGIASLRYDDRGYARSTGNFDAATSADFADDAEAAVRFLQGVSGIARDRVGIIGHSEGGLIGPLVATRTRDVAFVVMLAGPGLPGDSLTPLQLRRIAAASGEAPAQTEARAAVNSKLVHAVADAKDSADALVKLAAIRERMLASLPEAQRSSAAARFDQSIPALIRPWMRFFLRYDPRPVLEKVRVPVLALGGSLDTQVPARENLAAIDTALRKGGNRDYRVVELPKLNHLFQTAITGASSEYATIDETFSPQVLDLVSSWINERFARPK
ncbi:MAG TPA: CocE/NonD family hydrolase [Gemmatimonadaceae bacterium]